MSNVVLSDDLLKLYFSFVRKGQVSESGSGNNVALLTKLLSCIKEFYTNKMQLERCNITEEMFTAVESMPLFNLDNSTTDLKSLVAKSKLKLLLLNKECKDADIISYNILSKTRKSGFHYSMAFKAGEQKLFATNHIQQLLSNAIKVEIVDRYFSKDKHQFTENMKLLKQFIIDKTIKLEITCDSSDDITNLKNELARAGFLNTVLPSIHPSTHDRYIKANGLKIYLSSGFYPLTQKNKEIIYMVDIL